MSLEEEKPPKTPQEPYEEEKNGIFAHVGNFFGWIGELITEQARIDAQKEDATPPVHIAREITLQQQKTSEVIANAEAICNHLDEIKLKLIEEFGKGASCFISKCINPMTDHARQLIQDLKVPASEGKHLHSLLSQAIESVELYQQFSDERKLKKKIVQVAQQLMKQSIDKDLEVLANYKKNAIENSLWPEDERELREFQIDGYLYPIISELIGMSESRLTTDDLRAFFVWKSNVDERRNSLVELGLLTIDAMTESSERTVIVISEEEEEIILEEPFPQLVKHQLEDASLAMSYLATLEDRVNDIFMRIQEGALDDVEQLLEYLKVDAERFVKLSSHTKRVLDSFKSIKEDIVRAEEMITQMRG